jgi:hypothetical protein
VTYQLQILGRIYRGVPSVVWKIERNWAGGDIEVSLYTFV